MSTTTQEKTICTRCGRVIFTFSDSFVPDPFSPSDPHGNIPLMDTYANGHHIRNCDNSIAAKIEDIVFSARCDLMANGKTREEADEILARRKKAWLGK